MKKLAFIFLILFSIKPVIGSFADILNEDPWRVLQYKFVTKPQKKANSWKNLGIKGIAATGTGLLSVKLYQLLHSYIFSNQFSLDYKPKLSASTLEKSAFFTLYPLSLLTAVSAFLIGNQVLVKMFQKEELLDLLRNWDKYQKHIPESLIKKLQEVHQAYVQHRIDLEIQADEINEVIISQINLHFYGDPKATNFFDVRYLTANFNTHCVFDIARVIESCIKGYRAYRGQ